MINFVYTNSTTYKESQPDPSKSIGGYLSSTSLANGIANNLFPDLAYNSIVERKKVTHCMSIAGLFSDADKAGEIQTKNVIFTLTEMNEDVSNIVELFLGVGMIGGDTTEGLYMEKLLTPNAKPLYLVGDWIKFDINEPITIENVSVQNGIGIWLMRTVDLTSVYDLSPCSQYWCNNDKLNNLNFEYTIKCDTEDVV